MAIEELFRTSQCVPPKPSHAPEVGVAFHFRLEKPSRPRVVQRKLLTVHASAQMTGLLPYNVVAVPSSESYVTLGTKNVFSTF
jgi:hypothetical protein